MEKKFVGKLTIINNDESHGEILEFNQDILIGRDKECDIRFKLPSISRKHAKIVLSSSGKFTLHHLSKTNPSIVNGKNVHGSIELKENDVVCLADRIFLFSFTDNDLCESSSPVSPTTSPATEVSPLPRVLNENLKKAIEERRKSLQLPPPDQSLNINLEVASSHRKIQKENRRISVGGDASFEVAQKVLITPEEIIVLKPVLSTPIREAIKQRRQSLRNRGEEQLQQLPQPSVMPTPLKRAIQARCKAVIAKSPFLTETIIKEDETATHRSLFSPLKNAICARRKSVENLQLEDAKSVLQSPIHAQESNSHLNPFSPFHTFSSPEKGTNVQIPQSLKKAIEARRKSYRSSVGNSIENECGEVRKSFLSPLKNRLSECSSIDKENRIADSDAVTLEDVLHASALQITLDTVSKHSTGEVVDEVSVAFLIQQESTNLVNQLEQKVVVEEVSLNTVTPKAKKPRRRESLLMSLEKKGSSQFSETASGDNQNIDLVSLLSDEDMELIETYANLLPKELGLDDTELFAIALDAFMRGMELVYFKQSEGAQQPKHTKSTNKIDAAHNEEDLSDSLRFLFKLPSSFIDATYSDFDEELVEYYAQELQLVSKISEPVAYGVSLDTYLSDPVQFRHRVGNLALPEVKYVAYVDAATSQVFDEEEDDNCTISDDFDSANGAAKDSANSEGKRGRGRKTQERKSVGIVSINENTETQSTKRTTRKSAITALVNDEKKMEEEILATNPETETDITAKRPRSKRVSLATSNNTIEEVVPVTPAKRTRASAKVDDNEASVIQMSGRRSNRIASKSTQDESVDEEASINQKLRETLSVELQTPAKRSRQAKSLQSTGKSTSKGSRKTTKQNNSDNESEEENALVIICDGCEKEYFVDDIGLKTIPEGDWFCKGCTKGKKVGDPKSTVGSNKKTRK